MGIGGGDGLGHVGKFCSYHENLVGSAENREWFEAYERRPRTLSSFTSGKNPAGEKS